MSKLTTQKQGRRILQTQRHLPVQLQITETTVRIPLWTYILLKCILHGLELVSFI